MAGKLEDGFYQPDVGDIKRSEPALDA